MILDPLTSCPDDEHAALVELVAADLLDAVDPETRALVDAHLARCPDCRVTAAMLREALALWSGLDAAVPPDRVWLGITGQVQQHVHIGPADLLDRDELDAMLAAEPHIRRRDDPP